MREYIGTKMVKAEPAVRMELSDGGVEVVTKGDELTEQQSRLWPVVNQEEGYRVVYPDGYKSWSPKAVFEEAYLPLSVNPNLKTDAPSISQEMVDGFIAEADVQTMGDKTTVVRAVLRNGFEIVESSACVSAENYDEKLGAKICMGKIKDKVWSYLGFLLQTAVHGVKYTQDVYFHGVCPEPSTDLGEMTFNFGVAIALLKKGKRVRRKGWNGKGIFLELQVPGAHSKMTSPYIYIDTTGLLTDNPDAPKSRVPWLASQTDMLAEDWVVVD